MSEAPTIARRGFLLVLSSPSGAGKTTLARGLLDRDPGLTVSVSATTRKPRADEVDGRDYHFLAVEEFARRRDAGAFLEWAHVFGNMYGTLGAPVSAAIAAGRDMLFDVDWQGAANLRQRYPDDVVTVFILPPSGAELERRLRGRAQDDPDVVARRMAAAAAEISHWAEYDYVIVNRDVASSLDQLAAIVAAERARRSRTTGLSAFVEGVLREL